MTSGLVYWIAKQWSSLVQKTAYFYLLSFAFCKRPNIGGFSDSYSVSASLYIDRSFTFERILLHFKCSISIIFVNKRLKLQKSIKMKRVQAMAVTDRVPIVDLDLGLDSRSRFGCRL